MTGVSPHLPDAWSRSRLQPAAHFRRAAEVRGVDVQTVGVSDAAAGAGRAIALRSKPVAITVILTFPSAADRRPRRR